MDASLHLPDLTRQFPILHGPIALASPGPGVDAGNAPDTCAAGNGICALHLDWQAAYECGEPTIDAQHRELFRLGNQLIAAAMKRERELGSSQWRPALYVLVAYVVRHFHDEEALLGPCGGEHLAQNHCTHAALLVRAGELMAALDRGGSALGTLVDFLAKDVVAGHVFMAEREFHLLFGHGDPRSAATRN
jgi:hemerythrin